MALRITYVPFNSSHMGKALSVLLALRQAGAILRILCLDELQVEKHRILRQIQTTDFSYDYFPRGAYRPHSHWFVCALQQRPLIRSFESFIRWNESDLFIFSDDSLVPTRLLARALVRHGVPYVVIADGLQPPLKPSYRPSLRDRLSAAARHTLYGWGPRGTGGAHRVLVITKTCGKVLQGYGIAAERIIAVGSPEYDRVAARRLLTDERHSERSVQERLDLSSDRPIVFYAHQQASSRNFTEGLIWDLVDACRRAGASLLVKFHPHSDEDPVSWRALAQSRGLGAPMVSFFKNECTSIEAIQVSAACVTAFSTVSLEAMIYGRPVIVLQYLSAPQTLTFARDYGAALDVNDSNGLAEAVRLVVEDVGVRERLLANAVEALRKELYALDGHSLQRTVNAILDIGQRR